MKTLNHFFVKVPNKSTGTLKLGDKEIFLDTRFNEFEHRVCHGEILSSPCKQDTGAKPGDTLFFHHHVTSSASNVIDESEGIYMAIYDNQNKRGSHAIAYRDSEGDIHMLADWVFLEPLEEGTSEEVTDSGIILSVTKETKDEARVVTPSRDMVAEGVVKGDVVGFLKDRDYKMKLDDDSIVYRMKSDDIPYAVK